MDSKGRSPAIAWVLGCGLACIAGAASAQSVAWRTEVMAEIPAGEGVGMLSHPAAAASSSVIVAMMGYTASGGTTRYRAVATDADDGSVRWSYDFGASCSTLDESSGRVATLPDGDVVVSMAATDANRTRHACLAKLSVTGERVWSRDVRVPGVRVDINGLAVDPSGDVLAVGRRGNDALMVRVSGVDGSNVWERQENAGNGEQWRAFDVARGPGDGMAVHVLAVDPEGGWNFRVWAVSAQAGQRQWSHTYCQSVILPGVAQLDDVRLRVLADGSITFVATCSDSGTGDVSAGRLHGGTGAPVWQRIFASSRIGHAFVDEQGGVLLEGRLTIGGQVVGTTMLEASQGQVVWSLAALPDPGPWPYVSRQSFIVGDRVHVVERDQSVIGYIARLAVETYAKVDGVRLSRVDVPLASADMIPEGYLRARVLADGDVVLAASVGRNRYEGQALFEARVAPITGALRWSRRHHVGALQHVETVDVTEAVIADASGVIVAGASRMTDGPSYPVLGRLDAVTREWSWSWDAAAYPRGEFHAIGRTGAGDVVATGDSGDEDLPWLLTRVAATTGRMAWSSDPSFQAIGKHVAEVPGGRIVAGFMSRTAAFTDGVAAFDAGSGERLWIVGRAPGNTYEDVPFVAAAPDGDVLAATTYGLSDGTRGFQVRKLAGTEGTTRWTWRHAVGSATTPVIVAPPLTLPNGDVVVVSDSRVWCLVGGSGVVRWQAGSASTWGTAVIDAAGHVVVGGMLQGRWSAQRLEAASGAVMWTRSHGPFGPWQERISALSRARDGRVLAAGGDGYTMHVVGAIDMHSGDLAWSTISANESVAGGGGHSGLPIVVSQSPEGSIYAGIYGGYRQPMTLLKVATPIIDAIFAHGFDPSMP